MYNTEELLGCIHGPRSILKSDLSFSQNSLIAVGPITNRLLISSLIAVGISPRTSAASQPGKLSHVKYREPKH